MGDKTANLKQKKLISRREIIVVVMAIALTTAGIQAADRWAGGQALPAAACPEGMVLVPYEKGDFCIDRYEASAGSECPYDDPAAQGETRINLDNGQCEPVSRPGAMPWRYVSQDQARLACAKAGKRLPTNEEWFAAALGTPDRTDGFGPDDCQVDNNWPKQPGPSGSGEKCQSAAGTYDMVGNVWEWVKGAANDGLYKEKELPEAGYVRGTDGGSLPAETDAYQPDDNYHQDYFWIKKQGVRGIARGGYWDNSSDAGQYSMYIVTPPSEAGAGTGFRCVSSVNYR